MVNVGGSPFGEGWASKEFQELLVGQGGLFNDGLQGPAFKVFVVKRDSDAECRLFRVFEDTVVRLYASFRDNHEWHLRLEHELPLECRLR